LDHFEIDSVILRFHHTGEARQMTTPEKVYNKIQIWILFNVFVALTPIVFHFISYPIRGLRVNVGELLAKGDLLLVTAALAAGAIGDIMFSGSQKSLTPNLKISKTLVCGCCVLLLMLSSLIYAQISTSGTPLSHEMIVKFSSTLFGCTFFVGLCCGVLAEL
jgi:hypothetical protein